MGVKEELRRINSYATKIYKMPKSGDVYTNNKTVMMNILTYPRGESTQERIDTGVEIGKII